ncbi:DMT family transporter [Desulfatirhabdium butyrativorans]|uniref:DMT family transporter n=1 Tax=Desulfatirhabdium butyrativorans TaxID=340467 RepID=UPI000414859E|nr:DMT family transporter [Desulfatirhabdium butyrativorans]
MNKALKADWLLLLTAVIWGCAFVAQREGMKYIGPFTFNGIRFFLGAMALIPLIVHRDRVRQKHCGSFRPMRLFSGITLGQGLLVGAILFCGASLQQIGMVYTTAAKGGFITGLYVILVPFIGRFLGQRIGTGGWIGAMLATIGLFFLSINEDLAFAPGDLWVLLGAIFWSAHVLLIGWLSPRIEPVQLACAQFLVCSLLSLIMAALIESTTADAIRSAMIPILYGGFFSVGIAYTLQVVAQQDAPPTHAAVILSMETVVAAIAGWIILGEGLSPRAICGCALMLAGMLVVQLAPLIGRKPSLS